MNPETTTTVQVVVPVPLRQHFDYQCDSAPVPGTRVLVPFGRRKLVGLVISCDPPSSSRKLKRVEQVLDLHPVIGSSLLKLLHWAAKYYHHPIGEVISSALPVLLRSPRHADAPREMLHYRAVEPEPVDIIRLLGRSPVQARVYRYLQAVGEWASVDQLKSEFKGWRNIVAALKEKSLVESQEMFSDTESPSQPVSMTLNQEQRLAADYICSQLGQFNSILLQGITGSGKTEVYLAAARQCIAEGNQVLILVPEISLTPQLVARVRDQLGGKVCTLHSGMTDRNRYNTWWMAKQGLACAVLGTRSAVFTCLKSPGLIVVDEEHDMSYKQQDGFRYHARDLAIKRASVEKIPIVLGSATPSLESLYNVQRGRHHLLGLKQRIGCAQLPTITPVDLGIHVPENGLSKPVLNAIAECLDNGEQAIIYINRRGYAPVAHCYQCQWQACCHRCDARMTYHRTRHQFRCHHCGNIQPGEESCPVCETPLFFGGAGTQRIEKALLGKFPHARICRLDRDTANTAARLYRQLEAIKNAEVDLIIGTQLISKGHDFAKVSLVCVVNADQGLFSLDFRAPEYMFQQLLQVSGRAGRTAANGRVLIQTRFPDNAYIQMIRQHDYSGFAEACMTQRQQAEYPPWSRFALFRAEAVNQQAALRFLQLTQSTGTTIATKGQFNKVEIMNAVPAPMEKLAGRYRAQLLVRSTDRGQLHGLLGQWVANIDQLKQSRSVRWSLDIDPMDMY